MKFWYYIVRYYRRNRPWLKRGKNNEYILMIYLSPVKIGNFFEEQNLTIIRDNYNRYSIKYTYLFTREYLCNSLKISLKNV